jgi:hypothetical protein
MELTLALKTKLVKGTFDTLVNARRICQESRVEEFLKFVDLRYDAMSVESNKDLNVEVESEIGLDILARFSDAITKTSSKTVRMAVALIYCEDSDFNFDPLTKRIFISAMKEMDDELVEFLLLACDLEKISAGFSYSKVFINSRNNQVFHDKGWDEELMFVFVNDLIRLRLLLPEPQTEDTFLSSGSGLSVAFGVSDKILKMASVLRKAKFLLIET